MKKGFCTVPLSAFLLLCVSLTPSRLTADNDVSMSVAPAGVEIGAFFHGSSVNVTANTPLCEGVIVKIQSDSKKIVLNKKEKVGVIWMNVSKVAIEGAPEVYLLASSGDVETICSEGERHRLKIGLQSLESGMTITSEGRITGQEFKEFVKLKRHTGKYKEDIPVAIERVGVDKQFVTAALPLPSVTPSGTYTVGLYCFDSGALIGHSTKEMTVETVGLPRLEAEMSEKHPAAYGIMAIVVAMSAGIAMGTIFSSRGGGGH